MHCHFTFLFSPCTCALSLHLSHEDKEKTITTFLKVYCFAVFVLQLCNHSSQTNWTALKRTMQSQENNAESNLWFEEEATGNMLQLSSHTAFVTFVVCFAVTSDYTCQKIRKHAVCSFLNICYDGAEEQMVNIVHTDARLMNVLAKDMLSSVALYSNAWM